jgi:hypothetical protein
MNTRFRDWLLGVEGKPGRKPIPVDLVLDLWLLGMSSQEILRALKDKTGRDYAYVSMLRVVVDAREDGDPRAVYRRRTTGTRDHRVRRLSPPCYHILGSRQSWNAERS